MHMRAIQMLLLSGLLAPGFAQAMDCAITNTAQPLRPTMLAPVASELGLVGNPVGMANGALSQGADESQSVDQVLLRIRMESCQMATATPAPGVVNPDNPGAYKPRTQYDNTPWRFNMSQNGKNMTADEFSAWMKSRGVRVARGISAAPLDADPTSPGTVPASEVIPAVVPQLAVPVPVPPQQH